MKEVTIKITFDDTDGYKGYGNNVGEIIKEILEREIDISLVYDKVIKNNFSIEIVSSDFVSSDLSSSTIKKEVKEAEKEE